MNSLTIIPDQQKILVVTHMKTAFQNKERLAKFTKFGVSGRVQHG